MKFSGSSSAEYLIIRRKQPSEKAKKRPKMAQKDPTGKSSAVHHGQSFEVAIIRIMDFQNEMTARFGGERREVNLKPKTLVLFGENTNSST